MRRNNINIVTALLNREHAAQKFHPASFRKIALELAEYSLLERLRNQDLCQPLDDLSNETESVFNVEQSHNGCYAATVQTNKSVNIFEVSSMKKTAEYHTNERSVWTLAFHPSNPAIIAFGTLGGKVFVYVDGKESAWLEEPEPIASLCFHPIDNYLVLASGNEVTFWDWSNNSIMSTGTTYNDSKCRFLRITSSSMLVTGISQTLLFSSASIGKNLTSVEPQYLMASFLRTVNYMLDCLEHGCTIGNSFNAEFKKQFYLWNHLLKVIIDKTKELRCFVSIKTDAECTKSYLNKTLVILNRRIDSILETVERSVFRLLPDSGGSVEHEYIEQFCRLPMLYFEQVCSSYVEQMYSGYIRYVFDLTLVKNILYKIFKLYFDYGHKLPFEEWLKLEYHIDSCIISRNAPHKNQFILQAWDLRDFRETSAAPDFKEDWKNIISICSINNDSNVSISQCEQFIASVHSKAVHEMEVRSLCPANFGECVFVFRFTANFVSLSFSPSGKYIVIGLRCKKRLKFAYILDKDTRWKIGVDFRYDLNGCESRDADTSLPNETKNMHGVKRVIAFCILTAVLPASLIILPLYLRHTVFADVVYPIAESDIIEIRDGISTVFCQRHTLQMNTSFNAFQLNQKPEISQNRKHIRLKKSMSLPDDTLEYWGFYLLKGATVALKVCSRYDGSRILVVKGERNLRTCGLLDHNKNKVGAHYNTEHIQVKVTFESAAEIVESSGITSNKSGRYVSPDEGNHGGEDLTEEDMTAAESVDPSGRTHFPSTPTKQTKHASETRNSLDSRQQKADTNSTRDDGSGPATVRPSGTTRKHTQTSEAPNTLQASSKEIVNSHKHNPNYKDSKVDGSVASEDQQRHRRRRHHGKHGHHDKVDKQKAHLQESLSGVDMAMDNIGTRARRDIVYDRKINHGGNAMNFSNNNSDSESSFENSLLTCYDGDILVAQSFPPSHLCKDVQYLENGIHMVTKHEVASDGYYYYIFYSDNDYVQNDIHAVFDIYKPTFQYSNISESKGCVNSTNCSFPISFWSDERVIVEVPTRDGIEHEEDDITFLISTCQPRMAVYIVFPITVLFLVLTCAFL